MLPKINLGNQQLVNIQKTEVNPEVTKIDEKLIDAALDSQLPQVSGRALAESIRLESEVKVIARKADLEEKLSDVASSINTQDPIYGKQTALLGESDEVTAKKTTESHPEGWGRGIWKPKLEERSPYYSRYPEVRFNSEQAKAERNQGYVAEWKKLQMPNDVDKFNGFAEEREKIEYLKFKYETWRSMNPNGPVEDFYKSDFYAPGAIDVSMETLEVAESVIGGPALLKGGWQLAKLGLKKGDDMLKYLIKKVSTNTDEALDATKLNKPKGVDVDGAVPELPSHGPTRRPAGQKVNVRQLEKDYGYDSFAADHLDAKAKQHGVTIEMKPANPQSLDMIKRGEALAKPELLKPKTTNKLDLELGAPKGSEGKVTFFEPQKPAGFDKLPKDHPLVERYDVRMKQWKQYQRDMAELQKPPSQRSPEFQEAMRKQYGKDVPLEIEIKDGVVFDKATGKPFTGDYDIWAIRDAKTGELVDPARAQKVFDDLGYAGNPQHGPGTAHWNPTTHKEKQIKEELEWEHNQNNPNGQNLLIFDGSGLPSTGWAK